MAKGKTKVTTTTQRAGKFDAVTDVKAIGKGRRSLRDMYSPPTTAHVPISADCDVRSKDFGAVF